MIYHMWSTGDELPETIPEGCEHLGMEWTWKVETWNPRKWGQFPRRWPAEQPEQHPTAFELLSIKEQEELTSAYKAGKRIQYIADNGGWCNCLAPFVHTGWIYRIKPEPTYDFKVTMNGEPVNPKDISKETWMSFRGEQA